MMKQTTAHPRPQQASALMTTRVETTTTTIVHGGCGGGGGGPPSASSSGRAPPFCSSEAAAAVLQEQVSEGGSEVARLVAHTVTKPQYCWCRIRDFLPSGPQEFFSSPRLLRASISGSIKIKAAD